MEVKGKMITVNDDQSYTKFMSAKNAATITASCRTSDLIGYADLAKVLLAALATSCAGATATPSIDRISISSLCSLHKS